MPVALNHIDEAIAIARRHGATRVVLFGSTQSAPDAARDLDLAIGGVPGWDFYKLAAELDAQLPVPVDVVPLEPANTFTQRIQERGRVIYEEDSP